jgi:hypothetical protein
MSRNSRIAAALRLLAAAGALLALAASSAPAKQKPVVPPTARTPVDKGDCLSVSQAFYRQAKIQARQTKQSLPREFTRVASNLDEFCGEEDFAKARISIDWMDTCLKNFTKDDKQGLCSRTKSYFCAIDPRSDGCLQSQ